MSARSVWHAGERALHDRFGVSARMAEAGPRLIRDYMPDQHREFFEHLPFVILGCVDGAGRPWAGALVGQPGFVRSPDPRTLRIAALPEPDDPLSAGFVADAAIGLLGIEPHTRRRNRANGRILEIDATCAAATIGVEHSFGNCPKYIRPRALTRSSVSAPVAAMRTSGLDPAARAQIEAADTLFVASHVDLDPGRQVDVSHRGGEPGFVCVDRTCDELTIPDYAGNQFFNTLGNLVRQPRVGLLFVDFVGGDLLHVTGEAELLLDRDDPRVRALAGAERAWHVHVHECVRRVGAWPLRESSGE